jgi:porphobilinogen deaminase
LSLAEMLPAAGQGIIAVETRNDMRAVAASINHQPSERAALAERGVLQKFGTTLDCYSAVAVHATSDDTGTDTIRAFFGELEGDRAIRVSGTSVDAVYDALVREGAMELVR